MVKHEQSECIVCKHPMPQGAKKCIQCNSYQSRFWRYLSSINIQSLVALVPIVTMASIILDDKFGTHESDLKVTPFACESNKVRVVASNLGDRAAILAGAHLHQIVDGKMSDEAKPLKRVVNPKVSSLIKPGDTAVFDFIPMLEDNSTYSLSPPLSNTSPCDYKIRFDIIAFDHEPKDLDAPCACLLRNQ